MNYEHAEMLGKRSQLTTKDKRLSAEFMRAAKRPRMELIVMPHCEDTWH